MFEKKNYQQAVIHIEGMHCAMCSTRMCNAFVNNKHVKNAKVDLQQKTASVTYDAEKLSEEDLKRIVTETGYTPV